jgi:hypothetical protein
MSSTDLLSTTADFALDLIEKNGVIVPFCRAVTSEGEVVFYSPETSDDDTNFKNAEAHQRSVVLQEIKIRKLVGLAFCKEVVLTMKEPDEEVSAVKIELHQVDVNSSTYYFPYRIENGKAVTLPHHVLDVEAIELWTAP